MSDQLLTAKQVATRIGVSEQTLAHWRSTRRQSLPYVSISSRCVRYRDCDVEAWIASNMVGTEGESQEWRNN